MIRIPLADKKIFTGLEVDGDYVKLAQAEESSGLRKIIKLIVRRLGSQSEKDIAEALKGIVAEVKGHIGHLTICIPRHKVTVRFLHFPSVNEKEIAGMVKLQSAKELPFSKEEIISDYVVTERTKDGYTKVALVIAHQDEIHHYLEILKKAGLEPEIITFSTEAVLNWYQAALRQKSCSILIDLDTDNTDIAVFYNSQLVFTRGLVWGFAQLQAHPELKNKLTEEIRRTIEGYTRLEDARRAQRIFLGQAGKLTGELKPFLTQEFDLPCEIVAPSKNLSYQEDVSFVQERLGLSLLRVLGAVLVEKGRRLNLLPGNLLERQLFRLGRRRVLTTLILLFGVILLGLGGFAKKIHNKQTRIFYLDREIKKTAPQAKDIENILKQIELIETRRKIEGSSIDVLRELYSLVSGDISLSRFSCDEEIKAVMLQGVSTEMSEIFKFINTLEKSAYFKNVQLKYVSEKKAKSGGLTDFKIECSLEK